MPRITVDHLVQPLRRAPGVHREGAGVGVAGQRRVHRVGQPALLPDLLEQPGARAAAERGGQHGQRAAARVVPATARACRASGAPARCRPGAAPAADPRSSTAGSGAARRHRARRRRPGPPPSAERRPDQLDQPRVLDVAGRGHHHPRGRVLARARTRAASPGSARAPTPPSRAPARASGCAPKIASSNSSPSSSSGSSSRMAISSSTTLRSTSTSAGRSVAAVTTSASTSTASGRSVSSTCA